MGINMEIVKSELKRLGELESNFGEYSKVYLNTTENISGIMSNMDIKDKSVLTVAGSGDQAVNAYLNGAKSVSIFDVNPLSFIMTDLKITGARKLSHSEFCDYFIPVCGRLLDYHIFNKLSNYLCEDTAIYFDYLYHTYTIQEIFNKTMYHFYTNVSKLHDMNDYLKRENFEKLPAILEGKSPTPIKANLTELKDKLEGTYDAILLSNISDSIDNIWDTNTLRCYKRFIHTLSKRLNNGGIIQCGYIYSKYSTPFQKPIIVNREKREKIFTKDEFRECNVETFVNASPYDDTVIYYEKKRRN